MVYFWFHLTRLERRFPWCSLGESHFCRKDLHYYTVVFSANSLTKYLESFLGPNFRFLEQQRKIRRKKTLHFVSSFMISTKTKEVIFFPTFRLKSQLISICFSGFSRFVALCNCSNPSYSLLSYGAKFIIGS